MSRLGRLSVAAITFAAATALPLVIAAPAHADSATCVSFLEGNGYTADQAAGCEQGAAGDFSTCFDSLGTAGVLPEHAAPACVQAMAPTSPVVPSAPSLPVIPAIPAPAG